MADAGAFGRMSVVARVGEEPMRAGAAQCGAAGAFVPAALLFGIAGSGMLFISTRRAQG